MFISIQPSEMHGTGRVSINQTNSISCHFTQSQLLKQMNATSLIYSK